jgi:xanthosine utilization system XapX-like protein
LNTLEDSAANFTGRVDHLSTTVPEPPTLALMGISIVVVGVAARRRRVMEASENKRLRHTQKQSGAAFNCGAAFHVALEAGEALPPMVSRSAPTKNRTTNQCDHGLPLIKTDC